jgi:hypothetical protein
MARSRRTVVVRDLVLAASNVTVAVTSASTVGGLHPWPLGVVMCAFSALLFGAADRSDVGDGVLAAGLAGAIVVFAAALWWALPGSLLRIVPPLLLGLGLGTATNRLLFGVVYPLPDARLRRENIA